MAKKKISLAKEEKKVNSLTAKFNKWYCCPDDALDYLMQTGEVSHNGKKYTLNENELLVARYGRENAEDILKSRMRRNKESNTGNKKVRKMPFQFLKKKTH